MDSSRAENENAIRSLLAGLHEGELDRIDEVTPADFVGESVDGVRDESREQFKQTWKQSEEMFAEIHRDIEWVVVEDDRAVAKVHERGIRSDTWADIPVTNREIAVDVMYEFRLRDGLVTYMRQSLDSRQIMPAAMRYGRGAVLDGMRDGVIAIDTERHIVDANPAALEILHASREDVMGEAVDDLFDDGIELTHQDETRVMTHEGRIYQVETSLLTDPEDERIGEVLVFRDSTDRIRRNQQLDVLNRVLRHNLRNGITVVQGALEAAGEDADGRTASILSSAEEEARELLSVGETARNVQELLDDPSVGRRDLEAVLPPIVDRARREYPSASIASPAIGPLETSEDSPDSDLPAVEATETIGNGLWELLANACEHAGDAPEIEFDVRERDGTAVVSITDNGPGIPDHEVAVLDSTTETDLKHGSGLGLWLSKWVIQISGGTLDFEVSDGTTARVTLQLWDESSTDA